MKRSIHTRHITRHVVEITPEEIQRLICKAVLAPADAKVSNSDELGNLSVEWEVETVDPVFVPPMAEVRTLEH
jgi:hypothetical protein